MAIIFDHDRGMAAGQRRLDLAHIRTGTAKGPSITP
jgi:hypothetical protein